MLSLQCLFCTRLRRLSATCLAGLLLLPGVVHAADIQDAAQGRCQPNPLGQRDLYLRGSFNGWAAADAQRFTYLCNRFELVTKISGTHSFKLGDEAWSADADLGGSLDALTPKGAELRANFTGWHRFLIAVPKAGQAPAMTISTCAAAPLGDTVLLLRGGMNNWAALDRFAFQYSCDAYYLNVKLDGRYDFRIADVAGNDRTSFGAQGATPILADRPYALASGMATGSLNFGFNGEQTIKLAFDAGKPVIRIGAVSFADPNKPSITDPLALSVHHDSRLLADKSPFGAVAAGTKVKFALQAKPGLESVLLVVEKRRLEGNQEVLAYSESVRIPLNKANDGVMDRWTGEYAFKDVSVYGYYFEIKIAGKSYVYGNNRQPIYWTREAGSNGVGQIEALPEQSGSIRRFRHTVYAADFKVPAWASDAVYYYIFPDRFRNGDKRNDPKPGVDTYQDKPVEFHTNWLDKPARPDTGDSSDKYYNNDFFGGDLTGIIEKLDYIKDLGANTIYMTPVFRAASNHKYDTADYKQVDPAFGTNDDFSRLTREAAKRGIRVIPDTSLNHTGSDSVYFDRFSKYGTQGAFEGATVQPASPYASWYSFDTKQTEPDKQYKGWVGVLDLPEINKASPAFRQFAYGAKDSVMKAWLDRGAAGWRMDVAPWVPDDFWREWRTAIKQHKPDALTVAETWFDASKYFLGDTFDSTMNYIFRSAVIDYAAGGKASSIYKNIEYMREVYPPQAFYGLMNLLSTHDTARTLHLLGDTGDNIDVAKIAEAKKRLRLAVFFQMTFPGSPAIYYGDEVGVSGGEDPYNRATYPWEDLGGKPDLSLLEDVKKLVKVRRDHPVLRHGSIAAPLWIDDQVIVQLRTFGNQVAIVATNNAPEDKTINIKLPADIGPADFHDLQGQHHLSVRDSTLRLPLPALGGVVFLRDTKP